MGGDLDFGCFAPPQMAIEGTGQEEKEKGKGRNNFTCLNVR